VVAAAAVVAVAAAADAGNDRQAIDEEYPNDNKI
jgi:hypothetical protein